MWRPRNINDFDQHQHQQTNINDLIMELEDLYNNARKLQHQLLILTREYGVEDKSANISEADLASAATSIAKELLHVRSKAKRGFLGAWDTLKEEAEHLDSLLSLHSNQARLVSALITKLKWPARSTDIKSMLHPLKGSAAANHNNMAANASNKRPAYTVSLETQEPPAKTAKSAAVVTSGLQNRGNIVHLTSDDDIHHSSTSLPSLRVQQPPITSPGRQKREHIARQGIARSMALRTSDFRYMRPQSDIGTRDLRPQNFFRPYHPERKFSSAIEQPRGPTTTIAPVPSSIQFQPQFQCSSTPLRRPLPTGKPNLPTEDTPHRKKIDAQKDEFSRMRAEVLQIKKTRSEMKKELKDAIVDVGKEKNVLADLHLQKEKAQNELKTLQGALNELRREFKIDSSISRKAKRLEALKAELLELECKKAKLSKKM